MREHSTQNPWHNLRKRSCLTLEHGGATILHSVRNHLSSETVPHSQVHWHYITRSGSSPWTECPETAICEALKAVTMMMSINFWNTCQHFRWTRCLHPNSDTQKLVLQVVMLSVCLSWTVIFQVSPQTGTTSW
jgi:hypothetical protein